MANQEHQTIWAQVKVSKEVHLEFPVRQGVPSSYYQAWLQAENVQLVSSVAYTLYASGLHPTARDLLGSTGCFPGVIVILQDFIVHLWQTPTCKTLTIHSASSLVLRQVPSSFTALRQEHLQPCVYAQLKLLLRRHKATLCARDQK